jgi:hypothetical protein
MNGKGGHEEQLGPTSTLAIRKSCFAVTHCVIDPKSNREEKESGDADQFSDPVGDP